MSLDLTPIFKGKSISLHEDLLFKIDCELSIAGTGSIDDNYTVLYLIIEYSLEGDIINKDYKNPVKLNLREDRSKPYGLHLALKSMGQGETAVFRVHPVLRKSLQDLDQDNKKVVHVIKEDDKKLLFQDQIWVIKVEQAEKLVETLSIQERLDMVRDLKLRADHLFKEEKFEESSKLYGKIRQYSDGIAKVIKAQMAIEDLQFLRDQTIKSCTNQAVCHLKICQWTKVQDFCDLALKIEHNVKAVFLKARSLMERGLLDEALKLFRSIEQDFDVKVYIKRCQSTQNIANEQRIYKHIISKMHEKDEYLEEKKQQQQFEKIQSDKNKERFIKEAEAGKLMTQEDLMKLNSMIY